MDTITFAGQLLVATQNDTYEPIPVVVTNTSETCCNGYDVAIAGIICGTIVLIGLMVMRILLYKPKIDIEQAKELDKIENAKRIQQHDWKNAKEESDRKAQIEDRDYKKKHEYQKELLSYCREKYDYSQYITNADKFIKELNGDK